MVDHLFMPLCRARGVPKSIDANLMNRYRRLKKTGIKLKEKSVLRANVFA
jgi:hypothetical protein